MSRIAAATWMAWASPPISRVWASQTDSPRPADTRSSKRLAKSFPPIVMEMAAALSTASSIVPPSTSALRSAVSAPFTARLSQARPSSSAARAAKDRLRHCSASSASPYPVVMLSPRASRTPPDACAAEDSIGSIRARIKTTPIQVLFIVVPFYCLSPSENCRAYCLGEIPVMEVKVRIKCSLL